MFRHPKGLYLILATMMILGSCSKCGCIGDPIKKIGFKRFNNFYERSEKQDKNLTKFISKRTVRISIMCKKTVNGKTILKEK